MDIVHKRLECGLKKMHFHLIAKCQGFVIHATCFNPQVQVVRPEEIVGDTARGNLSIELQPSLLIYGHDQTCFSHTQSKGGNIHVYTLFAQFYT